jgi:hypothetical protein
MNGAEFPKLKIEFQENLGYRFLAKEEIEVGNIQQLIFSQEKLFLKFLNL